MVIHSVSPLESLLNLQHALDSMTDVDNWFSGSTSSRGGFPPINIFQNDENYIVITELPGIKREDVSVEIHRNRVRLSGEKKINYASDVSPHRRERRSGKFDRTFTTPFEIDADKVKAEYRDGILALFLPRAEHEKPRSVRIS